MAHRLLIAAGLAEGVSIVDHVEFSEDIKATLGILRALGGEYQVEGTRVVITGIGKKGFQTNVLLDSNESGSTLRFFIPIVLANGGAYQFVGAKRLFERPLGIYEEICKEQNISFEKDAKGLALEGKLSATHYKIPGNISSQFITGLLYALPLLDKDSILEVLPPIESKAYISMTLEALQTFGIQVKKEGNTFYIPGRQQYCAQNVSVEGDYSNAAFLEALNLIGGNVEVNGLKPDSLQGDKVYNAYFQRLQEGYAELDISDCPDLGPILIGMAAACHGAKLVGTAGLKIKESDRGLVMAEELAKFGVSVQVDDNEIIVKNGVLQAPTEVLQSHNDHRIAMTLATLCTITGGTIDGAESVKKSYPSYYEVIEDLGVVLTREV
jgi:3-phosphoshikimate 1-carboxyvinyltransferase